MTVIEAEQQYKSIRSIIIIITSCSRHSNMELVLRISWICLLCFSSVFTFPATNKGHRNPPARFWDHRGGPASPQLRSGALRPRTSVPFDPQPDAKAKANPGQSAALGFLSPPFPKIPVPPPVSEKKTPDLQQQPQISQVSVDDGVDDSPPETERPWVQSWAVFDPSVWEIPRVRFPVRDPWSSSPEAAAPQSSTDTSPPLPPSSYIFQTRDGYRRARQYLSSMKYNPYFYPEPEVVVSEPEDEVVEPQPQQEQKILE